MDEMPISRVDRGHAGHAGVSRQFTRQFNGDAVEEGRLSPPHRHSGLIYGSPNDIEVCQSSKYDNLGHRRRTSREVTAPTFSGSGNSFVEFLEDFERVAEYNQWNEGDKKFHLWNAIVGNAKIRIKSIPYPHDYSTLLQRLMVVFHNERSVEAYRDQLDCVKRDTKVDLETFGHQLLDLVKKAHPLALPAEQERIARDKFLETAGSRNMFVWLKANKPKSVEAAIDLAIQFQQATAVNSPRKPPVGNNGAELALTNLFVESEKPVKVAQVQQEPSKQSVLEGQVKLLAEELKALTQQLKSKSSKPQAKRQPLKCFGCDEVGHFKKDCPKSDAKTLN
jgi:hypothetical protein